LTTIQCSVWNWVTDQLGAYIRVNCAWEMSGERSVGDVMGAVEEEMCGYTVPE